MNFLLIIFGVTIITINITNAQNSTNCYTPGNQPGLCIELNQCSDLYNSEESQRSAQQNSLLRFRICGYSNGNAMYCCALKSIIPKPSIPTAAYEQNIDNDARAWVCGDTSTREWFTEISYGVKETKLGEFPWVALIEYTYKSGNRKILHCDGSLIHNRYVITTAYCITGIPGDFDNQVTLTGVRLGVWNFSSPIGCITNSSGYQECSDSHIDVPVERYFIHENYKDEIFGSGDIGLLRLARKVQFTDWISPICLPTTNSLRTATFDRVEFEVAGWGSSWLGADKKNKNLIKCKALVSVNPLSLCKLLESPYSIFGDDSMCAVGIKGVVEECQGVTGGALIGLNTKNKLRFHYFLAGIHKYGPNYVDPVGYPFVYTRVGFYVDWILDNIYP